jgi:hypothetical protein
MSSKQGHPATELCLGTWKGCVETEGLIHIQFLSSSVTGTEEFYIPPYKYSVEQENAPFMVFNIDLLLEYGVRFHTHKSIHTQSLTHSLTLTETESLSHKLSHSHAHTRSHPHTHTHSLTHILTHTHAHAHTHTHTHTRPCKHQQKTHRVDSIEKELSSPWIRQCLACSVLLKSMLVPQS